MSSEDPEDGVIARRLRALGSACAALMVAVLATAAAIGWSAVRPGAGDLMESPPFDSFLVAAGAMLLVLLASAAHGRILRRQAAAEPEESEAAGEAEALAPAARLRAYSWATGASFGMLTAAAALGAVVAITGKAPFYGLVICIAALFSMLARWPRRSGFDLALSSDRPDAVSRAAAWRNLAQPFASPAADVAEPRAGGRPGGEDPAAVTAVAATAAVTTTAAVAATAAVTALVGARLRVLRAVCGAMLAGVALLAGASVMVARLAAARPVASTGLSLTLTALTAVLILAASRLQAAILARAGRGAGEARPGGEPRGVAAEVVGAWARATVAGFASLAAVAALGLVVAAVTGVARYALVICGVAALGMLARWPRRAAVLGLLRRRGLA